VSRTMNSRRFHLAYSGCRPLSTWRSHNCTLVSDHDASREKSMDDLQQFMQKNGAALMQPLKSQRNALLYLLDGRRKYLFHGQTCATASAGSKLVTAVGPNGM